MKTWRWLISSAVGLTLLSCASATKTRKLNQGLQSVASFIGFAFTGASINPSDPTQNPNAIAGERNGIRNNVFPYFIDGKFQVELFGSLVGENNECPVMRDSGPFIIAISREMKSNSAVFSAEVFLQKPFKFSFVTAPGLHFFQITKRNGDLLGEGEFSVGPHSDRKSIYLKICGSLGKAYSKS